MLQVISNRMQKSVLVAIERFVEHKKYPRTLRRTTKLMAHDESNDCNVGDTVRIHITRPRSKRKCWEVTDILHRARVFDANAQALKQKESAPSFAASGI